MNTNIGMTDNGAIAGPSFLRRAVWMSFLLGTVCALKAADYPAPTEGDFAIHDFKFSSGESLPELKIHYRTIGKPEQDAQGHTRNAVLIMHGTTASVMANRANRVMACTRNFRVMVMPTWSKRNIVCSATA
jgi:hypothetical protein